MSQCTCVCAYAWSIGFKNFTSSWLLTPIVFLHTEIILPQSGLWILSLQGVYTLQTNCFYLLHRAFLLRHRGKERIGEVVALVWSEGKCATKYNVDSEGKILLYIFFSFRPKPGILREGGTPQNWTFFRLKWTFWTSYPSYQKTKQPKTNTQNKIQFDQFCGKESTGFSVDLDRLCCINLHAVPPPPGLGLLRYERSKSKNCLSLKRYSVIPTTSFYDMNQKI